MKLRMIWKHMGGAAVVYVIVAACSGGDAARTTHSGKDASAGDVLGEALDAVLDPVAEAEAATPPCTAWEYNVVHFFPSGNPTPQASAEWEPVGISTLDPLCATGQCPTRHFVLVRRCAQ